MGGTQHCGDSQPHGPHSYTRTNNIRGKIVVETYSCPGTSAPQPKRK